jgi:hypothetical protein
MGHKRPPALQKDWAQAMPTIFANTRWNWLRWRRTVILAMGDATLAEPSLQVTRTVPIVFIYAADPVGAGFVDALGLQAVMNPDVWLDVNCVILFERNMNRAKSPVYRHRT